MTTYNTPPESDTNWNETQYLFMTLFGVGTTSSSSSYKPLPDIGMFSAFYQTPTFRLPVSLENNLQKNLAVGYTQQYGCTH